MSTPDKSSHYIFGIGALLLCSTLWGTSFVAQSLGGQVAEPFTFNCARNGIATLFLLMLCPLLDMLLKKKYYFLGTDKPQLKKKLLTGGTLSGLCLTFAMFMQQWGIMYTSAGKSGFITALYIVLVPILGLFIFKSYVSRNSWLGVALATVGMYFICITEAFTITKGDFITLACPFLFAMQILIVDYYIHDLDGVRFSVIQFAVCSLTSGLLMFIFETPTWRQIADSIGPLLYLAIMSSGIAYTLQIIGQKYVDSVVASLLMSLESVFALLSGWIYLHQSMSLREISGCIIVFAAIILAQIPDKKSHL